jgi:hypothetical protein
MKLARTLLAASAVLLASSAHAQILNPTQTDNASVDLGNANQGTLTVNWFNGEQNVGLLQFDLSAFTSVSSAELNLYQVANADDTAQFGLFLLTSPWTPSSVNGLISNLPTVGPEVAQLDITDFNQHVWRSVDLTTVTNEWASGAVENDGLLFERTDQANPDIYFGAETGNGGLGQDFAPYLALNGATPQSSVPDSTPSAILTGIALCALLAFGQRRLAPSRS